MRGAQTADPELTSALDLFRRAANALARLEDAVVFNGLVDFPGAGPGGAVVRARPTRDRGSPRASGKSGAGRKSLVSGTPVWRNAVTIVIDGANDGQNLVSTVSGTIGQLEGRGQFGPFALVLGQRFFQIAQTPDPGSFVLPQDRIIPFLGGGSLLRCSALPAWSGVMIALGGAPVELIVATDMSLQFLQMTLEPRFVFRVFEKIVLRIKELGAITPIYPDTRSNRPPASGARRPMPARTPLASRRWAADALKLRRSHWRRRFQRKLGGPQWRSEPDHLFQPEVSHVELEPKQGKAGIPVEIKGEMNLVGVEKVLFKDTRG